MSIVHKFIFPPDECDIEALQEMYPDFQGRWIAASNLIVNQDRAIGTSLEWQGSDVESKEEPLSIAAACLDKINGDRVILIFFAPIVRWHEEMQTFIAEKPSDWVFPFSILSTEVPEKLAALLP